MRRTAQTTLRTAALGGWAVVALAGMPALTGAAWASERHGSADRATEGSGAPVLQQGPTTAGSRGEQPAGDGDGDRREDDTGVSVVASVAEPAPQDAPAPDLQVADALGPISGDGAVTRAPESGVTGRDAVRRVPVLSFDDPSPFAPTSLAGRLRDAPDGAVVQVAIRRGSPAHGCAWWNARTGRFGAARRGGCATARWITASARTSAAGLRWRAAFGRSLPSGTHRYVVRVLGADGEPAPFVRI